MRRVRRALLIAVIALVAAAAVVPLVIPIPPLPDTRPPRELAFPDSEFLQVEGLEIHVQQAGSAGTPLVLLHGFGASTFSWREVLAPLAQSRRVIAFDRPGFGLSQRPLPPYPGDTNPYRQSAQAELTAALLDALGIDRAVLVGNSAGGTIALLTALEHPERVAALVLVDAAVYTGGGAPNWLRPLLHLPQVRRLGPLFVRSIERWGRDLLDQAWHDPSKITPEVLAGYSIPLRAENWDRALWELTLASEDLDLASRLDEITVPVLVVTGDDDRIVPTAESVRLASEIHGARLVIIPACGHVPQEECPEAFLEAVEAFLATLPAAP